MERFETSRMKVDTYTRVCLTAIVLLLALLVLGVWGDGRVEQSAHAQAAPATHPFVNSGAQREELVRAQDQTTARLVELLGLLESGRVKVQVVDAPAGGGAIRDAGR